MNLAKISLIQYEKIGVWCPNLNPPIIHFSFPQDTSVSPKDMKFLHISYPVKNPEYLERLTNPRANEPLFLFTNSIWDELDEILEGRDEPSEVNLSTEIEHENENENNTNDNEISSSNDAPTHSNNPTEENENNIEVNSNNDNNNNSNTNNENTNYENNQQQQEDDQQQQEDQNQDEGDVEGGDNQILDIKDTLNYIITLLGNENSVFLTPLNENEIKDLITAYLPPTSSNS